MLNFFKKLLFYTFNSKTYNPPNYNPDKFLCPICQTIQQGVLKNVSFNFYCSNCKLSIFFFEKDASFILNVNNLFYCWNIKNNKQNSLSVSLGNSIHTENLPFFFPNLNNIKGLYNKLKIINTFL